VANNKFGRKSKNLKKNLTINRGETQEVQNGKVEIGGQRRMKFKTGKIDVICNNAQK